MMKRLGPDDGWRECLREEEVRRLLAVRAGDPDIGSPAARTRQRVEHVVSVQPLGLIVDALRFLYERLMPAVQVEHMETPEQTAAFVNTRLNTMCPPSGESDGHSTPGRITCMRRDAGWPATRWSSPPVLRTA